MLAQQAEALARELFPAGRRDGAEWRVGSLAGEAGQSLAVHLRPPKAGVWKDFAGGEGGDALDLVAAARFGGDKGSALRWARAWLGLAAHDPRLQQVAPVVPAKREPAPEDEEGRQKAKALWLGGRLLPGTPAEAYLAARGITLEGLGRAPGALRFRPDVWCAERRINAPAMLAAIVRDGKTVGCHRTYLGQVGGRWGKAPIQAAKKVLGRIGGGFIPLWRGASSRPVSEAPADDVLAICEGIEDGLTIALHQPDWRVFACISLGNMAAIRLPEVFQDVVLIFDRDGENPQARAGRERAAEELLNQGRSVREVTPPLGFKDFNAWHCYNLSQPRRGALPA